MRLSHGIGDGNDLCSDSELRIPIAVRPYQSNSFERKDRSPVHHVRQVTYEQQWSLPDEQREVFRVEELHISDTRSREYLGLSSKDVNQPGQNESICEQSYRAQLRDVPYKSKREEDYQLNED